MVYQLLADTVLLLHFLFILFVVFGGFVALRYPWVAVGHIPAACWGAFVELTGRMCPLTDLEVRFSELAGEVGYSESFIEHYLVPLIYPEGLTRETQLEMGVFVVVLNLAVYGWLLYRLRFSRPRHS